MSITRILTLRQKERMGKTMVVMVLIFFFILSMWLSSFVWQALMNSRAYQFNCWSTP
jgi:hypothetical protein